MNLLFNLSYVNSNFVLTLGYPNPALNNLFFFFFLIIIIFIILFPQQVLTYIVVVHIVILKSQKSHTRYLISSQGILHFTKQLKNVDMFRVCN